MTRYIWLSAGGRSTVGTLTGIYKLLTDLFAHIACVRGDKVGSTFFSFNSPEGSCDYCRGIGTMSKAKPSMSFKIVAMSENESTIVPSGMRYDAFVCNRCKGKRLHPKALAITLDSKNIFDVTALPIIQAYDFLQRCSLTDGKSKKLLKNIMHKLETLVQCGLGYLSLHQVSHTLSIAERNQIRLALLLNKSGHAVSAAIADELMYGLHPRDYERIKAVIEKTVIPEEAVHEVSMMNSVAKLRIPKSFLSLQSITKNNIGNLDVQIPLGVFCCISGVSGAGKRTLVHELQNAVRGFLYAQKNGLFFEANKQLQGAESLKNILIVPQKIFIKVSNLNIASNKRNISEQALLSLVKAVAPVDSDTLIILDQPTLYLNKTSIEQLLKLINRLIDKGNSMIVIEHNLDVLKAADYIIDMGPEGGDEGGTIVAQGTPADIVKVAASHTGRYLKKVMSNNQ